MSSSETTQNINDFDKLWDYSNPEETNKKFNKILPEVKASGDKSAYLQLMTQIARALGLQMKFDEAHEKLDEVEKQLTDDLKVAGIRYYLERGRILNSSKQKDRGKELFLRAYELAVEACEDNLAVDAAHMLGIIEPGDESLKWNETAMKLAEKSNDIKANGWLGSLYNNTGWTYHDMKNYDKALELFRKNVKWHTEKKSVKQLLIAKWCVARTLRSLEKHHEALEIQKKLIEEYDEKKIEHSGYEHEEIAECNLILGNNGEAKKYFVKAYEILSKDIWLTEYEKERLDRMEKLSREL